MLYLLQMVWILDNFLRESNQHWKLVVGHQRLWVAHIKELLVFVFVGILNNHICVYVLRYVINLQLTIWFQLWEYVIRNNEWYTTHVFAGSSSGVHWQCPWPLVGWACAVDQHSSIRSNGISCDLYPWQLRSSACFHSIHQVRLKNVNFYNPNIIYMIPTYITFSYFWCVNSMRKTNASF